MRWGFGSCHSFGFSERCGAAASAKCGVDDNLQSCSVGFCKPKLLSKGVVPCGVIVSMTLFDLGRTLNEINALSLVPQVRGLYFFRRMGGNIWLNALHISPICQGQGSAFLVQRSWSGLFCRFRHPEPMQLTSTGRQEAKAIASHAR